MTLVALTVTVVLTAVAILLSQPRQSLAEEMNELDRVKQLDGRWPLNSEEGLRSLGQHHLLCLLRLFYRELDFVRVLAVLLIIVLTGSFGALLALRPNLMEEPSLQIVLLMLVVISLALATICLVPFILAEVLTGHVRPVPDVPPGALKKPSDGEVGRYGK